MAEGFYLYSRFGGSFFYDDIPILKECVNRIQLAVYFGIGKYISQNTRKGKWGTGALDAISQILRKELPGLRGLSATQFRPSVSI